MAKVSPSMHPPMQRANIVPFIDHVLEKGVVVDARIRMLVEDVSLLEIRAIMALANFKTAAKLLEFPEGINFQAPAWRRLLDRAECPQCKKLVEEKEFQFGCPWCGYTLGG